MKKWREFLSRSLTCLCLSDWTLNEALEYLRTHKTEGVRLRKEALGNDNELIVKGAGMEYKGTGRRLECRQRE